MTAKMLTVFAGCVATGAIVTGTAVAFDQTQSPTQSPAVAPMTKLVIQHVVKGCHLLSNGSRQAASMSFSFKRGHRLQLLDQDIDPQALVQIAGPKVAIRGHMMMGQKQLVAFTQPGVYKFKTKVIEMGPMMNVKTIGPDNTLRLTVSVR